MRFAAVLTLLRELGTLKMLADFVREFVACTYQCAESVLNDLSARYQAMAKELGLPHVPLLFALKHGRISSDHYRTLAHIFEVLICDLPHAVEVQRAVHDVLKRGTGQRGNPISLLRP